MEEAVEVEDTNLLVYGVEVGDINLEAVEVQEKVVMVEYGEAEVED